MAISHQEGLQGRGDEPDCFIVDIERLSHGTDKYISANSKITQHDSFATDIDRDSSANSRIPRSFSRKGSHRGDRNVKAIDTAAANGDISFKGGIDGGVSVSLAENSITVPMGTASVEAMNKQAQAVKMMMMMNGESRCISSPRRRHGSKRAGAWVIGPRMVLAFFATLSSMGTILLIYFTLSIGKTGEEDLSQALLQ
ncbi:uncharacterized protein LOC122655360 [Telopea speciosissima]|uniref:uncharacterized protein LOC122655360 n=1 Tax=Telopea speciosissima TaxID=54955 RepID=UPI001CC7BEE3|nr:uncharacterized protein LOC122655360 [Telopea speciosissima]